MHRWKTTDNILKDYKEYFSEVIPPSPQWHGNRPMSIEDVDLWEVITEMSGPVGVYAAWCPYDELYIVTNRGTIAAEFSGWNANKRLENYLIEHNIPYPKSLDIKIPEFTSKKSIIL
jgi:hypothetical protein